MINWYILVGLTLRITAITSLVIFVIPIQLRELKRPAIEALVVYMRWILFFMVTVFIALNIFPISYQLSQLHSVPIFNLRNVSTVATNLGLVALTTGFVLLYKIASLLASKNNV